MPAVSIILPTYNRAKFLPQAFASIRSQLFTDWELIVVDDGSTDETRGLVADVSAELPTKVRYFYQDNQGAYGARNTGLDHAQGDCIAFFDSDDVWLPEHLKDCVDALASNKDLDWVYGACRRVNQTTGKILAASTFYIDGQPRPFMRLKTSVSGNVRVIQDAKAVQCALMHGLYCGLQNSVMRREVFKGNRFHTQFRNEAEDQLFVIRALALGKRLGYFDKVLVDYNEHESNSSASGSDRNLEKLLVIMRALVRGYEELGEDVKLTKAEERALRQRLGREYFWHLGYALLWQKGRRVEALNMFEKGLSLWPWSLSRWKTYWLAKARVHLQRIRPVGRTEVLS